MKKTALFFLFVLGGFLIFQSAEAQMKDVPAPVKDAFTQQYPHADSANYENRLVFVLVHFYQKDSASTAKYTSKGIWQWTETAMPFSSLPETIQDGFNKSKYLGWQVDHTYLVNLPGNLTRYKLQIEKSAIQKRNLFFNTRGRMISDNITMY
ncbi:MAG: PepSY-like domain-containing protein [Chitinophagaceae bacterium]